MKITVFGVSGETVGAHAVRMLLEKDHKVTVLVRSLNRFKVKEHSNLTVVVGNALADGDVTKVLAKDTEVVVTAIGSHQKGDDVASKSTLLLIQKMKEICPKARLIAVTALGCGSSLQTGGFMIRTLTKWFYSAAIGERDVQEKHIVDASDWLNWIVVRPGGLTDGKLTGVYRLGDIAGNTISRLDVADFIVKNLQGNDWKHKTPTQVY